MHHSRSQCSVWASSAGRLTPACTLACRNSISKETAVVAARPAAARRVGGGVGEGAVAAAVAVVVAVAAAIEAVRGFAETNMASAAADLAALEAQALQELNACADEA